VTSTEDLKRHLGILRRRDKKLSEAIKVAGFPESRLMEPGFGTLIRIIIDQQVSAASGRAIWNKLAAVTENNVSADRLLKLGEAGLRACGFSGQKARYSLGASQATAAGHLDFDALHKMEDDAIRQKLTALKGIGPWSADIYLMFALGRPDVWPVGDLALQYSAAAVLGLRKRPTPEKLLKIGEAWRPYRSSAALMLWRYWGHVVESRKLNAARKPAKA
jgi:DNA-3-methyladenine glycosylase II